MPYHIKLTPRGVNFLITACVIVAVSLLWNFTLRGTAVNLFTTQEKRFVSSYKDLASLYPSSAEEILTTVAASIKRTKEQVEKIIKIPRAEKTFNNTVFALSEALNPLGELASILGSIGYVHTDEVLRACAEEQKLLLAAFFTDFISLNHELYEALSDYATHNASAENLNKDQQYYLSEELADFARSGVDKPEAVRNQIKDLSKQLQKVSSDFSLAVAKSNKSITAKPEDLTGLSANFVGALKRNEAGDCIIPCDYPSLAEVMSHCTNYEVRKKFSRAFNTRGYPENKANLISMISLRDEIAQLLGYKTFSDANLDGTMAKTVKTVEAFREALRVPARKKYDQEVKQLLADTPAVGMSGTDKLYPWDSGYLMEYHRQKYYSIDDRKVAEYFPMESTIKGLFAIYEQFLGLTFIEHKPVNVWHEDVRLLEIKTTKDSVTRGYVFLDLYPRPLKYTHACHAGLIRAQKIVNDDGSETIKPSVAIIIANFPKATGSTPSLLKYNDATTFFHEFGHALHNLLGATLFSDTSGTAVKLDFVEMPSQMFEEWLADKEMLKKVTKHYQTGESMPDDMIERLISLKHFDPGMRVSRQLSLGEFSLRIFMGKKNDPETLYKEIALRNSPSQVFYDDESKFYAAFGHLGGYGARYYCYLWSEVFALDLFENIKEHGLLNTEYGQKFGSEVLGKGGSQDPDELLENFLGRKPKAEAFMRAYGFDK